MEYIGDYNADTWMVFEKFYKDNQLSEYTTSALELKEFNEVCEYIKTLVDTYRKEFDTIKHPRKSVYVLEKDNFKLVIKVVKI